MTEEKSKQHKDTARLLSIIGVSLGLGLIFDYFFYGKAPGISFPLYVALILAALLGLFRYYGRRLRNQALLFLLPLLFFSSMVFVRSSPLLTFLNIVASLFLLLLIADAILNKKIQEYTLGAYMKTLFLPFVFLKRSIEPITALISPHCDTKKDETLSHVAKGILMAVAPLFLFVMLFSSADMVFEKYLLRLALIDISPTTLTRSLIVFLVSLIFTGAFAYVFYKKEGAPWLNNFIPAKKPAIGVVGTSVFLGLIGTLFFFFILIQLAYLFGGEAHIARQGFTYAEYARKGFFELAGVAVISFLLLWATEKYVFRKDARHHVSFRILSGILIAEVLVIMISAFMRLRLYEEAYGFTVLRFYSHTFIIWLGAIFLILAYKILSDCSERFLLFYGFSSMLVFFALVNFINPDAFIARQNITRFTQTGKLDIFYLVQLSDDAIEEMEKLLDSGDENIKNFVANDFYIRRNWDAKESYEDWRSQTLSRIKAKKVFEARASEIEESKNYRIRDDFSTYLLYPSSQ